MFDGKAFGKEVVAVVRAHMDKTVAPLVEQIEALRKEIDVLKAIPAPKDGKDADPMDVAAIVDAKFKGDLEELAGEIQSLRGLVADPELTPSRADVEKQISNALATIPVPLAADETKAMIDAAIATLPPAEKGKDADPVEVAALVTQEAERILAGWERPQDGKDGAPGEKGMDGAPGKDGRDGIDVMDVVIDREGAAVFTLSDGRMKNVGLVVGKDGEAGRDGKDGLNGKDGADGLSFKDFDFDVEFDGERTFTLKWSNADKAEARSFRTKTVLDRGVFKEGQSYEAGDGVTWGGHYWIAQDETGEKPDSGKGWRMAVRKGRDGRDGTIKPPPKGGPVKVG